MDTFNAQKFEAQKRDVQNMTVNALLPSWARINEDGIGIIERGGLTLEVDMTDPDFFEQFMSISKQMSEYKERPGMTAAESMSEQVDMIDDFYDDLFGEETAAKLFATRSLMARLNFFKVLSDIGALQRAVMQGYAANPKLNIEVPKEGKILPYKGYPTDPRNRKERRAAERLARQQATHRKG